MSQQVNNVGANKDHFQILKISDNKNSHAFICIIGFILASIYFVYITSLLGILIAVALILLSNSLSYFGVVIDLTWKRIAGSLILHIAILGFLVYLTDSFHWISIVMAILWEGFAIGMSILFRGSQFSSVDNTVKKIKKH